MLKRFKKLCDKYGYKIVPVMSRVNWNLTRRPDILAVEKHGQWVMTIPKRMYSRRFFTHNDLAGRQHPSYFECEHKLYNDRFYVEK